jgi:hypothetical protein
MQLQFCQSAKLYFVSDVTSLLPSALAEKVLLCTLLLCPVCFLCLVGVTAGQAQIAADLRPQDKAHMEGTLISHVNGLPLPKGTLVLRLLPPSAAMRVESPRTFTAISDLEGRFVFDKIEPGRYTLAAQHAGFLPGNYRQGGSRVITLNAGEQLKDLHVAIVPMGVIAGQVVDEDGVPITEVQVQLLRWQGLSGARRLAQETALPVDDQGRFRAANLTPGQYYVAAEQRLGSGTAPSPQTENQKTYVTTFYPNSLDLLQAAPVSLNAGAEFAGIIIRLQKLLVVRIRGRAVDSETGEPVSNVSLRLMPRDADPSLARPKSTPIREGSFAFDKVLPGSYVIETNPGVALVGSGGPNHKKFFARYPLTVSDSDVTNLEIPFVGSPSVTGRIAMTDKDTAPYIPPEKAGYSTMTIQILPDEPVGMGSNARVNPDGTFESPAVSPGRYRVGVSGLPNGSYIKSIRYGDQNVTLSVLDLAPGARNTLEIVASPGAATVSGMAQNDKGEPAADVQVTLAPASIELSHVPGMYRLTRTNAAGQFSFQNLRPGEYRVIGWEEVEANVLALPEFRELFEASSRKIKLDENGSGNVEVKIVPYDVSEKEAGKLR